MEAYEGRSRQGDTSNSLICNTATIFKRNKGDKGDGDVSARITDDNDRAIPVTLRDGWGRKQGEKGGGEEKQKRGKKRRPWCKVHHHSCTDLTRMFKKRTFSGHPGVMKPWGTDSNQPNSQEAAWTNPNLHLLHYGGEVGGCLLFLVPELLSPAPRASPSGAKGENCPALPPHPLVTKATNKLLWIQVVLY